MVLRIPTGQQIFTGAATGSAVGSSSIGAQIVIDTRILIITYIIPAGRSIANGTNRGGTNTAIKDLPNSRISDEELSFNVEHDSAEPEFELEQAQDFKGERSSAFYCIPIVIREGDQLA